MTTSAKTFNNPSNNLQNNNKSSHFSASTKPTSVQLKITQKISHIRAKNKPLQSLKNTIDLKVAAQKNTHQLKNKTNSKYN